MRIRISVAVLGLACTLVISGSVGVASNCDPTLPSECTGAQTCDETMDDFNNVAHFQVEFLNRTYYPGADQTTFIYRVCRLAEAPDLSHWVLGLCSDLKIVAYSGGYAGSGPISCDPTTGLGGFKFETDGGVPLCDATCPGGSDTGGDYSITFKGNVPAAAILAGVTVATKAGQIVDDICLVGPSCTTSTTTSTSSTSSTTTTTTTTTSSTTASTSTSSSTSLTSTSTTADGSTSTTTTTASTSTTASTNAFPSTSTTSSTTIPSTSTSSTTTPTSSTITPTTTSSSTTTTTPGCTRPTDCDDGEICTADICNNGTCENPPLPPSAQPETTCNDMADNDCDGMIDCDDPDCAGIDPCPPIKRDPSKIKFGRLDGLDRFSSNGRVEPGEPIDVGSVEVGWMISKPTGAVWRGALIPGDLRSRGKAFRFKDSGAQARKGKRFGIEKAKIWFSRGGTSLGFKVVAYGDFSSADTPDMAIQFYVGDRIFIYDKPWTRTSWGWRSASFE